MKTNIIIIIIIIIIIQATFSLSASYRENKCVVPVDTKGRRVAGKLYTSAALNSGKNPAIYRQGGWVAPIAGMDILGEKNTLLSQPEFET